ncbi:hypothetical protein L6452_08534 [Arctium lappa]|uniref:Uncharacterized protein n=1 Tax=Arctium lappa TaxID=4217 RepID=A0ACB9DIK2_ARCLA|nr:hypothetical protein L6452_08534 [Arctium lappa]
MMMEHYNINSKQTLQRYKELQDIIAILGLDELSEDDRLTVARGATNMKEVALRWMNARLEMKVPWSGWDAG